MAMSWRQLSSSSLLQEPHTPGLNFGTDPPPCWHGWKRAAAVWPRPTPPPTATHLGRDAALGRKNQRNDASRSGRQAPSHGAAHSQGPPSRARRAASLPPLMSDGDGWHIPGPAAPPAAGACGRAAPRRAPCSCRAPLQAGPGPCKALSSLHQGGVGQRHMLLQPLLLQPLLLRTTLLLDELLPTLLHLLGCCRGGRSSRQGRTA